MYALGTKSHSFFKPICCEFVGKGNTCLYFTFVVSLKSVCFQVLFFSQSLIFKLCLQDVGRMKMELFADVVPKTAENFRYLHLKFFDLIFHVPVTGGVSLEPTPVTM